MEFYQACVLAGTVVLVAVLSSRAHWPAFLVLVTGTLVYALFARMSYPSIGDTFSLGFAQTLDSFGLLIVAGCIVSTLLARAGAGAMAVKNRPAVAAAVGLAASFGPSTPAAMALLRPWSHALAGADARARASIAVTMALALGAGQAFLFPSLFVVATRDILVADLALMVGIGLPLALITAAVGALFVNWMTPKLVSSAPIEMPAVTGSFRLVHALPVLAALILMTLTTIAQIPSEPLGRHFKEFIVFTSRPTVILVLTLGLTLLVIRRWDKDVMSDRGWIGEALIAAVPPLLAVGAAGGFVAAVQATGMAELIAERVSFLKLGIFVPFLVALAMKLLQGSSLTAVLTTCTLIEPLLAPLGLDGAWHRALAATAIGAGTLVAHINDPHFWLTADIAGLRATRALALHALGGLVQALAAVAILMLLALV